MEYSECLSELRLRGVDQLAGGGRCSYYFAEQGACAAVAGGVGGGETCGLRKAAGDDAEGIGAVGERGGAEFETDFRGELQRAVLSGGSADARGYCGGAFGADHSRAGELF